MMKQKLIGILVCFSMLRRSEMVFCDRFQFELVVVVVFSWNTFLKL